MRMLFLVLVLANAAFFAWSRYVSPPNKAADRAPLSREIDPHKLKVIPADALPPAAPVAPKPAAAPACLEWGSFALPEVERAEDALRSLRLGERLERQRTLEPAAWWVFIPPQGTRENAQRKAGELKDLGVKDFFVVQEEGAHRWAVSLGVFRTEDAAQARLEALQRQGVRSAQLGPRETVVPKFWLRVRVAEAGLEAKLREVAAQLQGSELRRCL